MDGLQICELIVVGIYACAEEEPGIPAVDNLAAAPELDKVGLVLLVARRHESVYLAFEFDLLVVVVGAIPFR